MKRDLSARVCVIGAGPSGITAAKNLLQVGLNNIVVYEKGSQVGGNWVYSTEPSHSSVFETTHIISSKQLSQYIDYPMPADYPDYPSQKQLLVYFQGYARHFGIEPYIRFNTEVVNADEQPDHSWKITLGDGSVEIFDHLVVANGHHWNPRMPQYPGEFTGEFLHSHDFKTNMPFRDQRVLVIGGGNSACDIAVETGRVSAFTGISWRRGYYIVPKVIFGSPPDVVAARLRFLPKAFRKPMTYLTWYLSTGGTQPYGLPKPDHDILQTHPVANSELLYFIKHGRIHPRRDIHHFEGTRVVFLDGVSEEYDVIIAATGFIITFPFFDKSFVDFSEGDVPLYLRVFPATHPSLYFIGLVQPQGCIWPLSDAQSKLVANYIAGNYNLPDDMSERIARDVEQIRNEFVKSPRHTIEVDYHDHLGELVDEIPTNAPKWKVRVPAALH